MKNRAGKILIAAIGILFTTTIINAATFTATANGDWGSAATWTLNAGVDVDGIPDADDTVTIPSPRVVTVTGAESVQNLTVNFGGTLTINGGAVLTLSGAAPSSTFTNNGTTNGAGIFRTQGTSSLSIVGTFTAPLEIIGGTTSATSSTIGGSLSVLNGATLQTTNQTITVDGDLNVSAGGSITGTSAFINVNGVNVVNNGSISGTTSAFSIRFGRSAGGGLQNLSGAGTFTSTINILNPSVTTLTGNVTFGNGNVTTTNFTINFGGTLAVGSNTLTLNGVSFSNNGTSSGSGSIRTQGTSSLSIGGTSFTVPLVIASDTTNAFSSTIGGSLSVLGGATLTTTNQAITVGGDLTVNTGGSITGTTAFINANGENVVNNGSISGTSSSFSLRFGRNGAQNLSGAGTFTSTINILNPSVVTLTGNVAFGDGNVTTTSFGINFGGTLAVGINTLTLNGVGLSNSGTVTSTGAGLIRTQGISSLSIVGTFTAPLEIIGGTTSATSSTIGGSLSVLNGATLQTTNQTITVDGDLNVSAGGSITGTTAFIDVNGANVVNNGSISGTTSAFSLRFGRIAGGGLQNLSGAGTFTSTINILSPSVTTLTGNVTFGNGNVTTTNFSINFGGTLAVGSNTLTLNGVGLSNSGTVTSTGAGLIRTQGTSSLSIGGTFSGSLEIDSGTTSTTNVTVGGSLTVLNGAILQTTNQTVTVGGNLTVNAGGSIVGTTSFLNANGANIVNNGSITAGSTRFGGGGAQTLSGTGSISSANVLAPSTTTLGSDHQFGTLLVNSGSMFGTATFTAFLSGAGTALTNNGTAITAGNFTYNGTAAQTVQGTNVNYNRLGIDNAAGVTLTSAETVGESLTLTNGLFSNGANLMMASGTTIARAAGSLGSAPTFGATINILYFGINPIATGLEIPPTNTINNLTDNNTNTVTLSASLTVNGNATLASGSTLNGGGGTTLTFNGSSFSNAGTESVPTTNFNGAAQSISGNGSWTGGTLQTTGASNTSLANGVTFSNAAFNVGSGTSVVSGINTLTFNGGAFTNNGTVSGFVRTTGSAVSLNAGATGFNAALNVNSGTTTAQGTVNSTVAVDATATALLVAPAQTLTVAGNTTIDGPLSGAGTFRFNGSAFTNTATVSVTTFQFGGAGQALGGSGGFSGNTATILTGSATTLSADKQMSSVAVNSAGTFNITNRILFLAGAGTPLTNAGTFTTTGSTVEYNGSAAQTLSASVTPYNNLSLNNAAGTTGFAGLTVNELLRVIAGTFTSSSTYKDVQIDTGATLSGINATTINVNGNWTNNGTFTSNSNTANFNGSTAQTIGGASATTFNNLTVANSASDVSLSQNATVNGALTLTNGRLITTASFAVILGPAGTSTGSASSFVVGAIQKTFSAPGQFLYHVGTVTGYSPATINVDSGTGSFSVRPANGVIPGSALNADRTLTRYWDLTQSGITQADITFVYPQSDVPVTADEANFRFTRNNGGTNSTFFAPSALDTTNNIATLNDVTQFSPWTLHDLAPTAASADIGGRVVRADGSPLSGVRINLDSATSAVNTVRTSDAAGNYLFPQILVGDTYIINAGRRGFIFSPASRVYNHSGGIFDLDFVATRDLSRQEATSGSDFDGDGRTDLAVFRPTDGIWYLKRSSDNSLHAEQFGANGDVPTAGDYDGDGTSDYAVYRPAEQVWYLLRSTDNTFAADKFGMEGDIPTAGDYNGDGKTDVAVYRPSTGVWYIRQSGSEEIRYEYFGLPTDRTVPADYDGDGKTDVAIYRPSEGIWYILQSTDGQLRAVRFGIATDEPVSADFDGDGRTDIAVYRHSEGIWHILDSATGDYRMIRWGLSGDTLVPADYDGDGKADVAVFRNGDWYILHTGSGEYHTERFGQANDHPIAAFR